MDETDHTDQSIAVSLTHDEALVLFEFIARTFDDDQRLEVRKDGELQALNLLKGRIETQLPELLATNYKTLIEEARNRLIAQWGSYEEFRKTIEASTSSSPREG
ncbi:MAG: hypothetical protein IH945_03155 [Armatimonadetes bacterium]|nr:hypothetical protein [Armatimonadota bacterium]